jgi:hypothetical protein
MILLGFPVPVSNYIGAHHGDLQVKSVIEGAVSSAYAEKAKWAREKKVKVEKDLILRLWWLSILNSIVFLYISLGRERLGPMDGGLSYDRHLTTISLK